MPLLPKIKPAAVGTWADDRLEASTPMRRVFNKVFPDHWSFMLGEIALYSFIVLLLSGTFLTLFFTPSPTEVVYDGVYTRLQGVEMSKAYDSALNISFEVRGGLVMRQIHHWSALMFVAAMLVHMFRTFFTGAFRRPRELNWVIGVTLFVLGMFEGFLGYSLPDDALSGTGLRIASAIIYSIPVVGTWVSFALFGGEFPGEFILERFYIIHVLLLPAAILGLIAAHMGLLVKQKHTQFPGPGRTEQNVVGHRMFPGFAAKAGGFFMLVFGVIAGLGGLVQINPIWLFGPYEAAVVSAGSQPDFYMMWLDGAVRLMPAWEFRSFGYTIPAMFWPSVVLAGVMFTLAGAYPWLEQKYGKDRSHHNLLQRPRDAPARTGLGMMAISFFIVLLLSGGNDIIADKFDISLNATTWAGRIGLFIVPPLAYFFTYRICLGLQQHDREVLAHGVESGMIRRLPSGQFIEVHQPLGEADEHGHTHLEYVGAAVPKKMNKLGAGGRAVRGFFIPVERPQEVEKTAVGTGTDGKKPSELSGASASDSGNY
ncbi:cytochrome b [Cryptosporangium arvum]|uniref:Cytochrome bc1 complex cytochrome b subunit n=1 Tax=Cryptosporangium arvum DSM 44712 TaxID=927661 RepID=A0A010YKW0_9ACTN|nr:cytochrome bc complex cytochrome b subunit [Cryptosporangium arvum]EXG80870.1 cytochrome b subunit of the bc complex [Cryptosporangium arvum DSM 44712]